MKKRDSSIVLALVAVLIVALAFTACDTIINSDDNDSSGGTTGGPSPTDPTSLGYRPAVYTATDGTETYRASYSYDDDGKLTQILWEGRESDGGDWVSSRRITFTYDSAGDMASMVTVSNDGATTPPTWTTEGTAYTTYNSNGRMTESIIDYPGGAEDDTRIRVEYADDRPTFLYRGGRTSDDAEWVDNARIVVTFSADGSTMDWDYQNENTGTASDPEWVSEDDEPRDTFTFDDDGRISTSTSERTEDGWTTSDITRVVTATYNDDGWIHTFTEVDSDDDERDCTPASPCTSVMTFSFDADTGLPTSFATTENDGYTHAITWEEGGMNDGFLQANGTATVFDGAEASWILAAIGTEGFF